MPYTLTDFHDLQAELLTGGLWVMLKKDLLQQVESPYHFNQATQPELGSGANFTLVNSTMSGVEAIATLANIGGLAPRGNGTDMVQRFGERYFPQVNPRYGRPHGQSVVMLLWDAYRNGGLHRFLPKKFTFVDAGQQTEVVFSVTWAEILTAGAKRSASLGEVSALRAADPTLPSMSPEHLGLRQTGANAFVFTVCAQALALEFIDAAERWMSELSVAAPLGPWFIDGANKFAVGLELNNHVQARSCLSAMIVAARAAAAPAAGGT